MSYDAEIPRCVPEAKPPVGGWTVATAITLVQEANAGHRRELSWAFQNLRERIAHGERVRVEDKAEVQRRLLDLNHENARVLSAQSLSVSREVWDANLTDDRRWKAEASVKIQEGLTKSEFWQYKQATDKALQLREGQSVGVGQFSGAVLQAASLLASLAAVAGFIYLLARGR
jgi:hypothetical protein